MAFTRALATNKYGPCKIIVASDSAYGTHTTLASAMADAVSGDTIFIRDSVTENITITPGVNIASWSGSTLNTPTITGTLTMTAAGTSTLSGLRLATNAAACIAVTGSAASILNVNDCYLMMGSDGITYSSSSSSSKLTLFNCRGDLTTTGIRIFAHSSAGNLVFDKTVINNTGLSTTANTQSAGTLTLFYSQIGNPLTTSGTTASYVASTSVIICNTLNVTAFTHGSTFATASASSDTSYSSGTAIAVSVSSGARLNMIDDQIGSNNATPVAGAGIIMHSNLSFFGTGQGVYTTTQTGGAIVGGKGVAAPSAGFIGEELISSVGAVAFTSNVAKSITSLSLTAGIWDLTGMISFTPTGGTNISTAIQVGIGTTNNTITGSLGQDYYQFNVAGGFGISTGIVPSLRVTLTATTTYYLVGLTLYTSTTCPGNGRFKATRVG